MKPLKFIVGVALLPLTIAATRTLTHLIRSLGADSVGAVSRDAWWLAGGFVLWLTLFATFSRPVRTYVLAHELTHAFWGLMMGARVSRIRVSARGGSVALSKTNFLIALAPYFFPFYTALVLAAHAALSTFYDMAVYEPFWLGLIGLTWAFHLTFTLTTLMEHQPDVAEHGRLFSYAVIYSLNVIGVSLWIVAVSRPTFAFFSEEMRREITAAYGFCAAVIAPLWAKVKMR